MSTNFQVWNPAQANQESDAQYTADALRSGGATTNVIFNSPLANKLFYQLSVYVAQQAAALAAKGYSVEDANASVLQAVFANILTQADCPLSKALGGTGTATPSLASGTGITITGSWPNQTITFSLGSPVSEANGGTGHSSLAAAGISKMVASPTTFASGPISPFTIFTTPGPGPYRLSFQAFGAAGSVGTALTVEAIWTQNSVTHTVNNFTGAVSTDGQSSSGSLIIFPDGATAVQVAQTQNYGSAYVLYTYLEALA